MPEKPDDLEAVRAVATALEPFNTDDRHRIIRWASEKLGLNEPPTRTSAPVTPLSLVARFHLKQVRPSRNLGQGTSNNSSRRKTQGATISLPSL